ncbi:hypothetical protein [Nonomuraea sp. NPDC050643]|uniref:hypothetical protein n=1 Tax=Nonomuraea sp. NPDC050643 TaxID=3155660 RepID=UPI0033F1E4CF
MAYESDRTHFMVVLGIATAASAIMPYAYPIVGLMWLLVSDPGEQDRAADQWLDKTPVNVATPVPLVKPKEQDWHPPMLPSSQSGAGGSDLAVLRSELKRMSKEIGETEDWNGRSYDSFLKKVEVLDKHLDTLDRNRAGCGDTLKCSAQAFHALVSVCTGIAYILNALALFVLVARTNPWGLAAELRVLQVVKKLHDILMAVFKSHLKLVAKATVILGVAGVAYNQFAKDLFGLQAVSGSKPNLTEASAMYNAASADIEDDPASQFDTGKFETPSMMPGW